MSIAAVSQLIQDAALFTALRESALMYPIVLSTHLASIALFGGMILMTDLRLLGVAMRNRSVTDVVTQLRVWKRAGFVIMVSCGILLAGSKAAQYYDNPYFQLKMLLLLLVGIHAAVFRKTVYGNTGALDHAAKMPGIAKAAAFLSLALWLGIMSCGRWIAYYERPQNPKASLGPPARQTTLKLNRQDQARRKS